MRNAEEKANKKVEEAEKRATDTIKETLNKTAADAQASNNQPATKPCGCKSGGGSPQKGAENGACPQIEKLASAVSDLKDVVAKKADKK